MESGKLNQSIINTGVLVILVILQHLFRILEVTQMVVTISLYFFVLLFTIIYFTQLNKNLKQYLNINIKPQFVTIVILYSITYLIMGIMKIIRSDETTILNMPIIEKIIYFLLALILFASIIITIIQYCILGRKIIKQNIEQLKPLGISFILIVFSFISVMFFLAIKTIKPYSHIFIIFELLPYWFTIKVYLDIKKGKIGTNQTTTTPDISESTEQTQIN